MTAIVYDRFRFACARCSSALEASADQVGTDARCPTCGAEFTIPTFSKDIRVAATAAGSPDDQNPTPVHAYAAAGENAPKLVKESADGSARIQCPRCRMLSEVTANACAGCSLPFTLEALDPLTTPRTADNLGTVAVVLGGMCLLCVCFAPLGTLLGAGAAICGILSLERSSDLPPHVRKQARAIIGLVLGTIGFALAVLQMLRIL